MRSRHKEDDSRVHTEFYAITDHPDYLDRPYRLQRSGLEGELYQKTTIDVVTPNYHSRIAKGEIINNPFTSITTHTDTGLISMSGSAGARSPASITYSNQFGGYLPVDEAIVFRGGEIPNPPSIDPPINRAVQQAYASCENTEVQSLVIAGESRKTVKYLTSVIYKVIGIMRDVRRLDWRALYYDNLTPSELRSSYLELRYAIRPLMYDARDIVNHFKDSIRSRRRTFRSRADASEVEEEFSGTFALTSNTTFGTCVGDYEGKHTLSSSVYAGILTELDPVSELDTLGMLDIPETIWELVPWSFIIDWFVNIGTVIAALTPEVGVKELTSWATSRTVAKTTIFNLQSRLAVQPSKAGYYNNLVATIARPYEKHVVTVKRIPKPGLSAIPSVNIRLNPLKLLDLVAILSQFRK